ncbi:hypothetical protein MMC18_000544 [Xylographa bjoerkii]|nr:hypothetical protein [Xylographa bjoerkii]
MAVVFDTENVPDITLFSSGTPNGIKIPITLEELGLTYKTVKIDMAKNTQKEPWFLEINPNGRIPALTDTFSDGQQIRLFESGSIMQYLIEQYDTKHLISYPKGSRLSYEVNNWLFFMNAGVGPMQGQANHFHRYAPEKIQYGVDRYQNETRRLYGVLEKQLEKSTSGYLVGSKCTIADIAHWGWVHAAFWAGIDIDEFPHLKAWEARMMERPAVNKGRNIPDKDRMPELAANKELAESSAREASKWVMKGQEADAKK